MLMHRTTGLDSFFHLSLSLSLPLSFPLVSTLEVQIYDLALRIVEGQGLPWPKPAYLRRVANHEKTRILVLRQLEVKLGVREAGEMVMATGDQIIAVVSCLDRTCNSSMYALDQHHPRLSQVEG